MSRLSPATDRRPPGTLPTALFAGLLAVLAMLSPPPVRAELPRLHQVVIGGAEHPPAVRAAVPPNFRNKTYEDLTILAIPQPLFHLTFTEDESFRFILPVSILYDSGGFGSRGSTEYAYTLTWADGSTMESTIPVPNRLLRIRSALLAAEDYWNEAAGRSGHSFELVAPDEPIDINIGYFVDDETGAYARYFWQEIRIRQNLDDEALETTPVHELFHILTDGIIRTEIGNPNDHARWFTSGGDVALLLFESTARWSEDEPVRVPAGAGGIPGRDIDTDYSSDCAPPYDESGTDLFERSPYCVSWLIKYYVEQIAGGSDTPMPEVVLDLIARAAGQDRLTRDSFIRTLADGLPAGRFPGATWQERWQRFYTSFAAAALVRRPSLAGGPGSQLAFHDDEFADETGSTFLAMRTHRRDYLRTPGQIYGTPAGGDAERAERLATIASTVGLPAFAYLYNVLELNVTKDVYETQDLDYLVPRDVEARPVFVYARGPEGTNAFLLRQQMTGYGDWDDRDAGSFERVDDFSLAGSDSPVVSEQGNITASGPDNTYVNLGFVNPGPASAAREISWAYLASPRLIPTPTRSRLFEFQHIAPVRLIGGSAYSVYDAERRHRFRNDDSFEFEVTVTGKLHLGAESREDIPEDERTIGLAIVCGGDDRPVLLAEEDGRTIRVTGSPSPREGPDGRYYYLLDGRIDPDNTVTGDCRVRVELTSLLNLGGGDRQVDESYTLRVGDPVPEVSRVRVTSGETVVYDSRDDIRRAAEPVDGAYRLGIEIWFSTPVAPDHASVTAGLEQPFDAYEIVVDTSLFDEPVWSTWRQADDPPGEVRSLLETQLKVPETDAPNGGFLWFSISAISSNDAVLDSNPEMPGDQRDTEHFALLGLDAPYLATLTWSNGNDLDLHVLCPDGTRVYYGNMRACGINLDIDMNASGAATTSPVENIRWPDDPVLGLYGVYVDHYANHGASDPTAYQVLVLIDGEEQVFDGSISDGEDQHFITKFTIAEPQPPETAGLPDPGNGDPDDPNAPGEEPGAEQPDDPDDPDENTVGTTGPGREETPVPPGEGTGEASPGSPVPGTVVEPTAQYPGVVQGVIANGSQSHEPGHVAVYLTGEGLPPADGEPLQMELNAGFPQAFVGVPAGGSIRFHNGEGAGGPVYTIFADSDLARFEHVLEPGDEAVVPFPAEGRLTVRSSTDTAHTLEVMVLPSTRFNVLNTISYIIRDVPPGTYMLRAMIENRRYQPLAIPVEVPGVGRLTRDITLVERGAGAAAGLAAE